ncbi:MAG: hypothetical protein E5X67_02930 [Mesorhizobium sp.]|nr:MAG: hypothetical protein E5X67_02930 [Mesorhizobium sp.]
MAGLGLAGLHRGFGWTENARGHEHLVATCKRHRRCIPVITAQCCRRQGRACRTPSRRATAVDRTIEIAPGVFFPAGTYNGSVPLDSNLGA